MQVVTFNLAEKGLTLILKLQVHGGVQSESLNCVNTLGSKAAHIYGGSIAQKVCGAGSLHAKVNL